MPENKAGRAKETALILSGISVLALGVSVFCGFMYILQVLTTPGVLEEITGGDKVYYGFGPGSEWFIIPCIVGLLVGLALRWAGRRVERTQAEVESG
jgi:hypothetical protein